MSATRRRFGRSVEPTRGRFGRSVEPTRRRFGVRGALVFAALALAVVGWLFVSRQSHDEPPPGPQSVLDMIPEGAMLVAVVDVAALRKTEVGRSLLGEGRTVAGLGEVSDLCGSDPMEAVGELAFAVPGLSSDVGFGVFATGAFDAERMLGCASSIVDKRGGRPVRENRDGFSVLRDASLELSSAELAVADRGSLVLAEPAYVRASLEVAADRAPSTRDEAQHHALRQLVERGVVTATAVLSEEQRNSLRDELRAQRMGDSPFAALVAGAFSLELGQDIRLHAVLRCATAEACSAIAELADAARRDEAQSLTARALGLSSVLQRMTITPRDDVVHLRAAVPVDEALALVRRAIALRRLSGLEADLESRQAPAPPSSALPVDAGVRIPATGGAPP